jgi:hypothetical protein
MKPVRWQIIDKVRDKAWKQASTQVNQWSYQNKAVIWSEIYCSREQIITKVYNQVVDPIWSQVLRLLAKPIQRSPK